MRIVLAPEAVEQLEAQIRYLRDVGATAAAERLRTRTMDFFINHLAHFPRTGRCLSDRDLWETWIPGTRLVVWYRIADDHLAVATVWHCSQDRFGPSV